MVPEGLGGNVSAELASEELSDDLCTLLIHLIDTGTTVDLSDLVQLIVMLNDRHSGLLVNAFGGHKSSAAHVVGRTPLTESLLNALLVIILSATGLSSLQEPLKHDFLGRGIEQDQGG